MPAGWIAAGTAAAGLIGASMQADATTSAAQTQANAAAAGQAQQQANYNSQVALQKPWTDAGTAAIGQIQSGNQPGGQFQKQFTLADATNAPVEQAALQQGTTAINNAAAAGGTQLSTNNVQNLGKFAETEAANYEGQAFNQWLQGNQFNLDSLQSQAQIGQTATNAQSNALGNLGTNQTNLTLAGANATAAGQVGSANAYGSGITNAINQGAQMYTLGNIFGNNNTNYANNTANATNQFGNVNSTPNYAAPVDTTMMGA